MNDPFGEECPELNGVAANISVLLHSEEAKPLVKTFLRTLELCKFDDSSYHGQALLCWVILPETKLPRLQGKQVPHFQAMQKGVPAREFDQF